MLTRLAELNNSSTNTSTQKRCKHHLRCEIRGHSTDCDDRNTNMNQQQEVDRQIARNEKIMSFWCSNVEFAIQDARGEADRASDAGFQLARHLYQDIRNPIVLVSRTAWDRLLELVRFCLTYAFGVRNTTWPICRNGIWARSRPLAPSRWSPPEERNCMVKRGLNLVYDLCRFLRLHRQVLNRMRQFVVDALHFVSSLCHEQEIAALYAFRGDPSRRFWWAKHGDKVIEFLGYQLGFKKPGSRLPRCRERCPERP